MRYVWALLIIGGLACVFAGESSAYRPPRAVRIPPREGYSVASDRVQPENRSTNFATFSESAERATARELAALVVVAKKAVGVMEQQNAEIEQLKARVQALENQGAK